LGSGAALPSDTHQQLQRLLPDRDVSVSTRVDEHLHSLIGSASDGDAKSLLRLQTLFPSRPTPHPHRPVDPAPLSTSFIAVPSISTLSGAVLAGSADVISPTSASQLTTLVACQQDVDMLKCDDLRGALEQFRDGTVRRLREKYGPQQGRKSLPGWKTIGQQISRRERLGEDFESEFAGDVEHFLSFFTYTGSVK
jgi:hypothetical protein